MIKMWDIRNNSKSPIKSYNNINTNNDIIIFNSKDRFISTAENLLNLWDMRTDKIIIQANPIQNEITRLRCDKNQHRLFTVSRGESFIKVLDPNYLTNLFSLNLKKEISCFDISNDLNRFAVGFTDGDILIKSRNLLGEDEEDIYKDAEEKDFELLE
jgi:WD40 repeat protein